MGLCTTTLTRMRAVAWRAAKMSCSKDEGESGADSQEEDGP